jgi:SRSO17 transposase
MKIINIYGCSLNPFHSALNMRQLLNPIFFSIDQRHPDMKRQHSRRQRSKDLAATRRLKAQYIPLCRVAQPDPSEWFDAYEGRWKERSYSYSELFNDLGRSLSITMGRRL